MTIVSAGNDIGVSQTVKKQQFQIRLQRDEHGHIGKYISRVYTPSETPLLGKLVNFDGYCSLLFELLCGRLRFPGLEQSISATESVARKTNNHNPRVLRS